MQSYVVEVKRGPECCFCGIGQDREGTYFPATSFGAIHQFGEVDDAKKAIEEMAAGAQSFLIPPTGDLVGYFTIRVVSVTGKSFGDMFAQPVHVVDVAAVRQYHGGPITIKLRDGMR